MSWRSVQLGNTLCDQDQLIVKLFQNNLVNYIGNDAEFAQHLNCSPLANNLILTINHAHWVSDILKICQEQLTNKIECVYLSVNRYCLSGNDTNLVINDLVDLLVWIVEQQGFTVVEKSKIERDLGRYFNFVQPITWIYGRKITN
tara:strand:+ start:958 stop:1392 length:435 start_codon:yes stop_codon:yes gene_type:complete